MSAQHLDSWQMATTPAARFTTAPGPGELDWHDVSLPVQGSDGDDHWFRHQFRATGASPVVQIGGLASVSDVYLDGEHVLRSESMFISHSLPVLPGAHELTVCARALDPLLKIPRKPRARWRSNVPRDGNLRWLRTTLLGRAPGFAPGPPLVGPWRDVWIAEQPPLRAVVRATLDGDAGVLQIETDPAAGPLEVDLDSDTTVLPAGGGELRVPDAKRWWPHTHGAPDRYTVRISANGRELVQSVGFRELGLNGGPDADRFELTVNGTPIFARGVVWTPVPDDELRPTLETLRGAGLNLIRVVGTTMYAPPLFHDLCDELGLLVWQDFMFANMDYPIADGEFRTLVETEVRQVLHELGGRPSLAVLCGNSEIEQQVGMLGLDPALGRGELFARIIPDLIDEAAVDAVYVPSAPTGGDQPFRTDRGVANYFGVGAYLRPLEDVRRSAVPFASECLAFANVPDATPRTHDEGVMRDVGASWDFADVRDHYLKLLHGIDRTHEDYWERSRFVTGEVMAEVFGEWRRHASVTSGGIILWSRDLVPGAGWGVLDYRGDPKVALHHLRRALAPVAVWTTDEGLNGLSVHVGNDGPQALGAELRVALYRDGEVRVEEAHVEVEVPPHTVIEHSVEAILGRFVDVGYAYRFGEPQHHLVVASLEQGDTLIGQAFRFPLGPPCSRQSAAELGLTASAAERDGAIDVTLTTARVAYGVRLGLSGFVPDEDAFCVEPDRPRLITLRPRAAAPAANAAAGLSVRALNLLAPLAVPLS
jgi:beta-mannosidase